MYIEYWDFVASIGKLTLGQLLRIILNLLELRSQSGDEYSTVVSGFEQYIFYFFSAYM